ncbi:MAG: phenylalanine 4-monooxygenase [Rickettsiales bacterium]
MTLEAPPNQKYKMQLREHMRPDFTVDQHWDHYTADDHAIWRELYARQSALMPGRACHEFIDGLKQMDMSGGVPRFDQLSEILMKRTGWQVVAVSGAVPGPIFFDHLANRRFPATDWIRTREQMAYLQEPDVFHDIFGHVPLLINPIFADYMQAYGQGGLKAQALKGIKNLGRLYWYTVEFGLIRSKRDNNELRIYGAGILSSSEETVYSLTSPKPQRVAFDIKRIMRTDFHITDLQELYFVIDDFEQLFDATRPDFAPYYDELRGQPSHKPTDTVPGDQLIAIG